MTSRRVYVDHLRQVALFQQFSRKDLERIAIAGSHMSFPSGKTLIEQGDDGGYDAFVLLSGTAVVKRNGKKVATLGAGAMIGELSLLDREPRTATVTCETDCELLVLSRHGFTTMIDDVPALTHKLFESLAARIRELDGRRYV